MIIKFVKKRQVNPKIENGKVWQPGQFAEVTKEMSDKLIDEGVAISTKHKRLPGYAKIHPDVLAQLGIEEEEKPQEEKKILFKKKKK